VLWAQFSEVRRLAGEDSFRAMAWRFIGQQPSGRLRERNWCERFPSFLRSQGQAGSFSYVADIAALEVACSKARAAGSVRPVAGKVLAALTPEQFASLRLVLHPSFHVVQSRFPILTIWRNNQRDRSSSMIERWCAEAALVTRPFRDVRITGLPPGGREFLMAMAEGQSVASAVGHAIAAAPSFDASAGRAILVESSVVVAIRDQPDIIIAKGGS
jgi:hypothetical protein